MSHDLDPHALRSNSYLLQGYQEAALLRQTRLMALRLAVEFAGPGRTLLDNRGADACPLMGLLTAES